MAKSSTLASGNSSHCQPGFSHVRGKMSDVITSLYVFVLAAFLTRLYVFVLAAFLGVEVIRRVSPLLHTPLMSLTNALDAIAVVGAIILAGENKSTLSTVLGAIEMVAATSNIVGGFMITDRMLKMFKASGPRKP